MMLHNLMSLLSAHFVHWFQYHSCTNIRLHGCVQAWLRVATGLHTPLQVVVGGMVGSFTALLWSLLWERNIFPALASETAMRVVEVDDKKMALLGDVVQSCSVPLRVLLWGACLGSILLFGSQVVVKWSRKQRPSLKPSQEKVDNKNRWYYFVSNSNMWLKTITRIMFCNDIRLVRSNPCYNASNWGTCGTLVSEICLLCTSGVARCWQAKQTFHSCCDPNRRYEDAKTHINFMSILLKWCVLLQILPSTCDYVRGLRTIR